MAEIPILLLAAGGSSRMGQPKQLLPWVGQTLIDHQIQTLLKTGHPVNVVIGSNSDLIMPVIEKYPVTIFINPNWESGMGSSISFGIGEIIQTISFAAGVLITLLDQPLITTSYIEKMQDSFRTGSRQILISLSSSGWTGVPVLFDKCYFTELSELAMDEGAKKVIKRHTENVSLIEAGELLEDMDTPETYHQLLNKYLNQNSNEL